MVFRTSSSKTDLASIVHYWIFVDVAVPDAGLTGRASLSQAIRATSFMPACHSDRETFLAKRCLTT